MRTLTGLKAIKHILDPIYGPIPLTPLELKIISEPIFQRLRNITQLSLASLVFPGATHNRFQHSLGTLHVMDKLLYNLKIENKLSQNIDDEARIIQKMRVAALLHDCGHLPFSHTFENIDNQINHEKIGKYIIEKTKINEILQDNDIRGESIGSLISGNLDFKDPDTEFLIKLIPLLHSDADADRMDYLLRDSHFTGVPYGKVDIDRICNFVDLHEDKICFHEKAQNALEDFLFSRYQMYKIVYIHKTVICYDLLLQKIYTDYIQNHVEFDSLPFFLPNPTDFKRSNNEWYEKVFCNITEANFFDSIRILLNSNSLTSEEKISLEKLYNRFIKRDPIKNCFRIDDLPEKVETEYCDTEKELFEELKNYPEIINHWSFLRHDPSKPLKIASPIKSDTDDTQDPEQIRIYSRSGKNVSIQVLQKKTNSYIRSLATHHRILICYYHNEEKSQKVIKELASKYFKIS